MDKEKHVQKGYFYIFLDTNTLMSKASPCDIFTTDLLKNVLLLRDFIERYFPSTKEMKIILPEMVLKERYQQKYKWLELDIPRTINLLEGFFENKAESRDIRHSINDNKANLYNIVEQIGAEYLAKNRIETTKPCDMKHFQTIIKKSIMNEAPFEKNSDKGFKDTIIWFSIVDYVKENVIEDYVKIILITHNLRQFNVPELCEEFRKYTGYEITCIGFDGGKSNIGITHPEFGKLVKHVLKTSQSDILQAIRLSYFKLHDKVVIEEFRADPLPINLAGLFNGSRSIYYDNSQNERVRENALRILKNLGFNTELVKKNVDVSEIKPAFIYVSLRDYKKQFLDFLDLVIHFDDGTEICVDYPEDQFSILKYYETPEDFQHSESRYIVQYLEELGYSDLNPSMVYFQVESIVRDTWD